MAAKMTTGIDTEARGFYQEVPDHLVDLCTAAEEYGVPIWRLRKWVFRGRLAKHGRLIARAPGGGVWLVSRDELALLILNPPKNGRPRRISK